MLDPIAVIAGIGTILTGVVVAGLNKKWVWGWTYADKDKDLDDMTKDRDFWRDTALSLLQHNDKALEVAAKGAKDG